MRDDDVVPEPAAGASADALFEYVELTRLRGGSVDVEALLERHPAAAAELRALLGAQNRLARAAGLAALASRSGAADGVADRELLDRIARLLEELRAVSPGTWPFGAEDPVGSGTFGVVTAADDSVTGRRVALKRANVGEAGERSEGFRARAVARLLEEARLLGRMHHAHVVPLLEVVVDDEGAPCLVMPFLEGIDLREAIERRVAGEETWSLPRLVEALRSVCAAVGHAHQRGVVHRDLKPDNVRLDETGNVHVIDWGLALDMRRRSGSRGAQGSPSLIDDALASRLTQAGGAVGTLSYMSPEQRRGDGAAMDERSDVFSLGAILHHVLRGRPPAYDGQGADGEEHAPGYAHRGRVPEPPAALVAICRRAMDPDRASRYRSAHDMAADLEAFLDQRTVAAYATGPVAELVAWTKRNRTAAVAGVVLVVSLVVATALAWRTNDDLVARNAAFEAQAIELEDRVRDVREGSLDLYLQGVELAHGSGLSEEVVELVETLPSPQERLPERTTQGARLVDEGRFAEGQLVLRGSAPDTVAFATRAGRLALLHGIALLRLGRSSEAARSFEQVPASHAAYEQASTALASIAFAEGRPDDAAKRLESHAADAGDLASLITAAWTSLRAQEVLAALEELLERDPLDQVSRNHWVLLRALRGDTAPAPFRQLVYEQESSLDGAPLLLDVLTACADADWEGARRVLTRATSRYGDIRDKTKRKIRSVVPRPMIETAEALIAWFEAVDRLPATALFTGEAAIGEEESALFGAAADAAERAAAKTASRVDLFPPVVPAHFEAMADGLRGIAACGWDGNAPATVLMNTYRLEAAAERFAIARDALGDGFTSLMLGTSRLWKISHEHRMSKVGPVGKERLEPLDAAWHALREAVEQPSVVRGVEQASRRWLTLVHWHYALLDRDGDLAPADRDRISVDSIDNIAAITSLGVDLDEYHEFRVAEALSQFGHSSVAADHLEEIESPQHAEYEALYLHWMTERAPFKAWSVVRAWLELEPDDDHALAARQACVSAMWDALADLEDD